MRIIKFSEAILESTSQMMEADPSVVVMGLGVPDPKGIFGTTLGLREKFGNRRVFDSAIAENSMMGIAIGASMLGMKPIITHQRVEFALLAVEQIVNQAAKWSYMTDGKSNCPLVIRMLIGRGWGQGPQHSQSLESWFSHIPGLKVVLPSNARDAKGLLCSAVKDPNPVIFFEHRWLHNTTSEVPVELYETPIGAAKTVREGKDVTIIAYSYGVIDALKSANFLNEHGISVEILDLRSLRPIDTESIIRSARKTGRVICLDLGWSKFGVSAEVISILNEEVWGDLKCAPRRIGIKDAPIPSTRALANFIYPSQSEIISTVCEMIGVTSIKLQDSDYHVSDVPDQAFTGPF